MKKTVWTYGLISGAILATLMMLTIPYAAEIGYEHSMLVGYTTMVLAFILVFFGVRSYRDNVAGGAVRFGRALAVGALIALVASTCYVAAWEVIYFKVAPEHREQFHARMVERARTGGGTPEQVQARVAETQEFMKMYQDPAINAAITLLEPLPVGLVFALVSAGVLSRRRRMEVPGLAAAIG
jgi:hypothetical protein